MSKPKPDMSSDASDFSDAPPDGVNVEAERGHALAPKHNSPVKPNFDSLTDGLARKARKTACFAMAA